MTSEMSQTWWGAFHHRSAVCRCSMHQDRQLLFGFSRTHQLSRSAGLSGRASHALGFIVRCSAVQLSLWFSLLSHCSVWVNEVAITTNRWRTAANGRITAAAPKPTATTIIYASTKTQLETIPCQAPTPLLKNASRVRNSETRSKDITCAWLCYHHCWLYDILEKAESASFLPFFKKL